MVCAGSAACGAFLRNATEDSVHAQCLLLGPLELLAYPQSGPPNRCRHTTSRGPTLDLRIQDLGQHCIAAAPPRQDGRTT